MSDDEKQLWRSVFLVSYELKLIENSLTPIDISRMDANAAVKQYRLACRSLS